MLVSCGLWAVDDDINTEVTIPTLHRVLNKSFQGHFKLYTTHTHIKMSRPKYESIFLPVPGRGPKLHDCKMLPAVSFGYISDAMRHK
jgi:hypothetical protein